MSAVKVRMCRLGTYNLTGIIYEFEVRYLRLQLLTRAHNFKVQDFGRANFGNSPFGDRNRRLESFRRVDDNLSCDFERMSIIYALVANGSTVLAEHASASGNASTVAGLILEKIDSSRNEMRSYVYNRYVNN